MILVPQLLKILMLQVNNLDLREGGFDGVKRQSSFISAVKSWVIEMTKILHVADVSYSILGKRKCLAYWNYVFDWIAFVTFTINLNALDLDPA